MHDPTDDPTLFDLSIGSQLTALDDDVDTDTNLEPSGDEEPPSFQIVEPERFGLRTGRFRGAQDGEFNDGTASGFDDSADRFRGADGEFVETPVDPGRGFELLPDDSLPSFEVVEDE